MGNDKDKETTMKIRKMKSGTNKMRVNQMKEKATRRNTDHPKKRGVTLQRRRKQHTRRRNR
jgi:hypothetical protein